MNFRSIVVAGAAGAFAMQAHASPVAYEQVWASNGVAYASQNDPAFFGDFAKLYDNFTLSSTLQINGLQWQGGYAVGDVGPINQFLIEFWSDSSGEPGTLVFSQSVSGNANETFLASSPNIAMYSYQVELSGLFEASAGTPYWLSIQARLNTPQQWAWASSNAGDGASVQDFLGDRFYDTGDVAFRLNAVPEPSVAALVVLGFAAMAAQMRRQRKLVTL